MGRMVVLVVNDDPAEQKAILDVVAHDREGATVSRAEERALSIRPTVVLLPLDEMMRTGYAIPRKLNEHPETRRAKVIAYHRPETREGRARFTKELRACIANLRKPRA